MNYPNFFWDEFCTSRCPVGNGKSEMGFGITNFLKRVADDLTYMLHKKAFIPNPILDYPNFFWDELCTSRCPVGNGKSEMGSGIITLRILERSDSKAYFTYFQSRVVRRHLFHKVP
ncbi:MAG: hypothetical protein LBB12_02340 [Holosporaceae bacterium]|nr:hypothetical protein [Holosporaceae bacterium]